MVAAGGAAGSVLRYGVATVMTRWTGSAVPYATAIVNVAGCACAGLLLGAIAGQRLALSPEQRALIFSGVLGGLTTFSGVGIDTLALVQEGRAATAVANVVLQVVLGLTVLGVCFTLTRR
jgi:CrcB protein